MPDFKIKTFSFPHGVVLLFLPQYSDVQEISQEKSQQAHKKAANSSQVNGLLNPQKDKKQE